MNDIPETSIQTLVYSFLAALRTTPDRSFRNDCAITNAHAWERIQAKSTAISAESWAIRYTNVSTLPQLRSKGRAKAALEKLSSSDIRVTEVAGERVQQILTATPPGRQPNRRN
jgi:hypothetical protein